MKPEIVVSLKDLETLEAVLAHMPASAGKQALLDELARADIVEADEVPPTVVKMQSTVRFCIDASGEEFVLTLVYPAQTATTPDTISVLSPVGSALLGMEAGGCIDWPRPDGGTMTVRILSVDGNEARVPV